MGRAAGIRAVTLDWNRGIPPTHSGQQCRGRARNGKGGLGAGVGVEQGGGLCDRKHRRNVT